MNYKDFFSVEDYPRDLIGYGRNPIDPKWPGGARVAVQFVVNYEEGGENAVLHGDKASEAFLSETVGAQPLEGVRNMNIEYPDAVAAMKEANWEIASHGLRWIDYQYMPEAEERQQIANAIRLHEEITGQRPLGWYTGRISPQTRDIVKEEGGFLYDSDTYADDLPYWEKGPNGPHLVIPYTLDTNDMRFAALQGFNAGDQFFNYLKDSFDVLYEEGEDAPKMMSIGLHCRLVGRPGRAAALMKFLDYVQSHNKAWVCRRIDIARHFHENLRPE